MTKFAISFAALLIGCISLSAQENSLVRENSAKKDAIYLLSGDASCLNSKGETCALKIDFSEAYVVNFDKKFNIEQNSGLLADYKASQGEEFVKNWPEELQMMEESTCNKLSKTFGIDFKTQKDVSAPSYLMVVRIGQFDFGHFVAIGSVKDGGTICKGIVELYDKDGAMIAEFDVNYLCGRNVGYGNNDRLREFGVNFAKELKKAL